MNKKAEAITLGFILLLVLIGGILFYENASEKPYIADNLTMTVYNSRSQNPSCDLDEIKIEKDNIVTFESLTDATNNGFNLSDKCF